MDGLGPVGFSIGNDGGGGCWSILRWRGVSLCVPWARCAQNMMGNILKENVDIVELPLRLSLRVGALAHCLFACVQCVCATCPRCVCVCTRVCGDSERQQDPERRSISALTSSSAASLLPATHLSAHQTPHLLLCPGFPRSRLLLKRLLHLQQEPRTVRPPLHLPHLHPPAPAPLDPPDICLTSAPASLPHIPVPGAWRRTQRSVLVSPDGPR